MEKEDGAIGNELDEVAGGAFGEYEGEDNLVTGEDGLMYREIEVREQDRFLPVANIARIMKKVLPSNAKIAKDGKETIQNCVSEFISFITSEASEKCQQEKRKTINGDDILWAMSTLGMEKYIEPLRMYLGKYRESVKGEKPDKKVSSATKRDASAIGLSMGGTGAAMSTAKRPAFEGGVNVDGADPLTAYQGQMGGYQTEEGFSAPMYMGSSAASDGMDQTGEYQAGGAVPGTIFEGPTKGTHQVLRADGTFATVRYVNPDGTPFTGNLTQVAAITHQPFAQDAISRAKAASIVPSPGAASVPPAGDDAPQEEPTGP